MRYFTGIITYLLFVSVHYFIWKAVFAHSESGAQINGFTLGEMVTYISIAWISRSLYHSNIDYEIDQAVRSGEISNYLIRPVNFQMMMISHASGESLFRLIGFTLPITFVIFTLFPVSFPTSIFSGVIFLFSTIVAFIVLAQINFIVGLSAFYLKSVRGVIQAKYYLVQLLSGLLMPIAFFPTWMKEIIEFLPFSLIANIPLKLYLGKIPESQWKMIVFEQVFWITVLSLISAFIWRRAVIKLTVQGG